MQEMDSIQYKFRNDKKKRNKSVAFIQFIMEKEDAPFEFSIAIKKNENPNSLSIKSISDQIQEKLFEFSANIKKILLNKSRNKDIVVYFYIEDLEQAIDCYRFFYFHQLDKIDQSETFLSDQEISILFWLKDFSKFKLHEKMFQLKISNLQTDSKNQKVLKDENHQQQDNGDSITIKALHNEIQRFQLQIVDLQKNESKLTDLILSFQHTFKNSKFDLMKKNFHVLGTDDGKKKKDQLVEVEIVQKQIQNFTCKICSLIVQDPQECIRKDCNVLCCQKCISDYWKSKAFKQCPSCLQIVKNNFQGGINKIVKIQLQSQFFKCPYDDSCSFKGSASEAFDHLQICEMALEQCPKQCGKQVAKRDLENHQNYLCKYSEVQCENCGILEKPYEDNFYHNCMKSIMNQKIIQ